LSSLEEYRAKIRETDRQLLSLVAERFSLGDKVAEVKKVKGLPTIDSDAEKATLDNLTQSAANLGITNSFARRLGELLIQETVAIENKTRPQQSKDQLLKEIFELAQRLISQGEKVTRFEIGEPNFAPPQQVISSLSATFRKKKIIGYGSAAGLPELRNALADELNKQHGTEIVPDQILITPGARFAIFAAITSFVRPLERVIIPQPAWPAYEECVNFVGGRAIPLNTSLENRWEIDMGQLESELSKGASMLVVNSPSNPTGKSIGRKRFDEITSLARKYKTMILSDEVYDKYVRSPTSSILESGYENSVYINSFSKQFSLTGWRIAYLVSSKENAMRIRRVIQTAVTCVPEFIQHAALIALEKAKREAQQNITTIMKKVELTCRELSKIDVSFYKPDGAFYIFPKANKPKFDSVKFAKQLIERYRVSISPGQSFGSYPEFFRLAVSLPEDQIPSAIARIGQALDTWS
jgi:aspartate aminotransferase